MQNKKANHLLSLSLSLSGLHLHFNHIWWQKKNHQSIFYGKRRDQFADSHHCHVDCVPDAAYVTAVDVLHTNPCLLA